MHLKTARSIVSVAIYICLVLFGSVASAALSPQLQEVVNSGKNIFTHSTFGGSGKTCNSCHLDGGTEAGELSNGVKAPKLINAAATFPHIYRGQIVTLEDQIRNCVGGAIQGTPPEYDSKTMRELMVYLTSLAQGKTIVLGGTLE